MLNIGFTVFVSIDGYWDDDSEAYTDTIFS